MTVLGIETATTVCGVAIIENRVVKAELHIEAPQAHSEKLLTMVDEVLSSSGLSLKKIDAIACSIGPGSFTGLRIGLSVAKGLAYASQKPLVAISTLEALAHRAGTGNRIAASAMIVPMIDARRDEVYYAGYRWNGDSLEEVLLAEASRICDLVRKLQNEKNVVLTGDGAEKFFASAQEAETGHSFVLIPGDLGKCSAASVAMLGEIRFERGEKDDVVSIEPRYVKEFYTTMKITSPQTV